MRVPVGDSQSLIHRGKQTSATFPRNIGWRLVASFTTSASDNLDNLSGNMSSQEMFLTTEPNELVPQDGMLVFARGGQGSF